MNIQPLPTQQSVNQPTATTTPTITNTYASVASAAPKVMPTLTNIANSLANSITMPTTSRSRSVLKLTELDVNLINVSWSKSKNPNMSMLNLTYGDRKSWLKFRLPMVRCTGIKKKVGSYGGQNRVDYYVVFHFDPNNKEHNDVMKAWTTFFIHTCNIALKNFQILSKFYRSVDEMLNCDDNNSIYYDPTYLSKHIIKPNDDDIKTYGYTMRVKLSNYSKNKTAFYRLNGSRIEWKLLYGYSFYCVPTLCISGIACISKSVYLFVRLDNAIVTSKREPLGDVDLECVKEYINITPDTIKEQDEDFNNPNNSMVTLNIDEDNTKDTDPITKIDNDNDNDNEELYNKSNNYYKLLDQANNFANTKGKNDRQRLRDIVAKK